MLSDRRMWVRSSLGSSEPPPHPDSSHDQTLEGSLQQARCRRARVRTPQGLLRNEDHPCQGHQESVAARWSFDPREALAPLLAKSRD